MGKKSKLRNAKHRLESIRLFHKILSDNDESYVRYLQSEHWQSVLLKYLHGRRCSGCDLKATELHHVTYENLYQETDLDVLPLCRSCHSKVHLKLDAAKKSVEWTIWALRKMFGWTRKFTNAKFNLSYEPGKKMPVTAGKI